MKQLISISLLMGMTAFAAEVDRREHYQQMRIAEGIASGRLTPGEAARLERREAPLKNEIRYDRAVNGGYLTPGERRLINRQEDAVSRQIYIDQHDRWRR